MLYDVMESPVGELLLTATDEGLAGVRFEPHGDRPGGGWRRDPAALGPAREQLEAYFDGRLTEFTLPLAPRGTPFQRAVWKAIAGVGFGRTIPYAELARRAGSPGSARAVGAATGRNPIGIIVPCHRIVGSNGALTGYAGGLAKKRALLALEGLNLLR